jgi:hypothetical protein
MNTQIESKPVVTVVEAAIRLENPMQERYCEQVVESIGVTAEAVFTAYKFEALRLSKGRIAQVEAGLVFVP